MSDWIYNDQPFTEPGKYAGFVYCIHSHMTGKLYIGKKFFYSTRRLPPLKGKQRKRVVTKESDWRTYYSSCKPLLADVAEHGKSTFTREIISLHENKTETNYAELCELIFNNVLQKKDGLGNRLYYNENIERVFYHSDKFSQERNIDYNRRLTNAGQENKD